MEEDTDPGWTKPKKSFRLKKTIPRGRPVLGTSSANRTLPVVPSQSVKRRNSFEKEDSENLNNTIDGPGAKRQKLGSIFSSSSMFSLCRGEYPRALRAMTAEVGSLFSSLSYSDCMLRFRRAVRLLLLQPRHGARGRPPRPAAARLESQDPAAGGQYYYHLIY